MSDVLTIEDLQAAKKHDTFHSEVITGKAGGLSTGANIDYATNQVTGQVQKTLPKVLRDLGKMVQTWTATTGGTLTDASQVFLNDITASAGKGNYYGWTGAFPHVVAPGTDPTAVTGYAPRTDAVLRDDLNGLVVYKANNVLDMISGITSGGIVVDKYMGQLWQTGPTTWQTVVSGPSLMRHFKPLNEIDFESAGGVNDGVTNNADLFKLLQEVLFDKTISFNGAFGSGFYLGDARADINNTIIKQEQNALIISDGFFGHPVNSRYLTPVKIKFLSDNQVYVFPQNFNVEPDLSNLIGSTSNIDASKYIKLALDVDAELANIGATTYNTRSAFSGVLSANKDVIGWTATPAAESGYFVDIKTGDAAECSFWCTNSRGAGTVAVSVLTSARRYVFQIAVDNPTIQIIMITTENNASNIGSIVTDPNKNYTLVGNNGLISPSVRVVGPGDIEFYINDCLLKKLAVTGIVQQVGFTAYPSAAIPANGLQIYHPRIVKNKTPKGGKPLNIVCVGDSVTFAASAAYSWPKLLKFAGQNNSGIGDLTVTNVAVPGVKVDYFTTGAGSKIDYSQYDYALVMLGTNDCQQSTVTATFVANLTALYDKIEQAGCKVIAGLFPSWTDINYTGVGSNTSNNEYASKYRELAKSVALERGITVANANAYIGQNMVWLKDNIHPNTTGQAAIAGAFISALIKDVSPVVRVGNPAAKFLKLEAGWSGVSNMLAPNIVVNNGVATFFGSFSGTRTGVITRIPKALRPTGIMRCPVVTAAGTGELLIDVNGDVTLPVGDATTRATFSVSYTVSSYL